MKVLFAVSNEEISESIVKKYQKEYKEIISYKNVYYFNAILKEIQKDKTYDRIVISEDLEAFTHTQYDQIDKFIFDKLDSISDEASNMKGDDIPIILICADRRTKSEQMLVKLFGIGIYNALLGNDRSVEEVCKLINKPRVKKDAKFYYKIDVDDVKYQPENENDVSEVEIQNILAHYKRLGKNEKKYVESFDNIAAQYNDTQLKIIAKFLPLNVRAVLEEQSPKYQQLIAYNSRVSNEIRKTKRALNEESGTSEKLLKSTARENVLTKPVVIPSAINQTGGKKLSKPKTEENVAKQEEYIIKHEDVKMPENKLKEKLDKTADTEEVKPKRRGRPRKNPVLEETAAPKRRGRPRKNVIEETNEENMSEQDSKAGLPGLEYTPEKLEDAKETVLPGFEDFDEPEREPKETVLPGFEDFDEPEREPKETVLPGFEGFDELEKEPEKIELPGFENYEHIQKEPKKIQNLDVNGFLPDMNNLSKENNSFDNVDISGLLTSDKKVACFVGTSKNGTSFIVNHVAEILSSIGIDTAILDTTKNRNSYYIYTKNEEDLRMTAMNCLSNLVNGSAIGIQANKNLTIYTSLPDENEIIEQTGTILKTLVKKHSLVLIDCDFDTPFGYFAKAQEIYLVQSLDVLTIQPLTAFLRELKAKNILEDRKLRIVLNKVEKLRGITEKAIIGGMSSYNDPSMSFMVDLFDKSSVRYISVPFDEEVYVKYLEGLINCDISLKGYPKNFIQILKELGNMIYPLVSGKSTYQPPQMQNNGFSPSMNSTLEQMRKY